MTTACNNKAVMPSSGGEMIAAPRSHPRSSQRHLGRVVSAACKDGEIFRLKESQFPKWAIILLA